MLVFSIRRSLTCVRKISKGHIMANAEQIHRLLGAESFMMSLPVLLLTDAVAIEHVLASSAPRQHTRIRVSTTRSQSAAIHAEVDVI